MWRNRLLTGLEVTLFWLAVWAVAARAVDQELLIPAPQIVAAHLWNIVRSGSFLRILGTSLLRVLSGFALGCVLGVALAVLSSVSAGFNALIQPFIRVIRSTPVTSFIILVMLWLPYTVVPVFIAALLVAPILFGNIRTAIRQTDPALAEVAHVFRFSRWKTIRSLYFPSALPYFYSGALTALGFAWKAGIAAEVLALPKYAVGSRIYFSKLYLETADLFAWTAIVVAFSFLFERLLQIFLPEKPAQEGKP